MRKPGRHSFQGGTVSSDDNFQALARYVIKRISEVKNNMIELELAGTHRQASQPYIIAEIAQAHDGSLGYAYSFVELAKEIGADAVKFKTHISKAESTWDEEFRVNIFPQDKTRYEYWQRMEFTPEQWARLSNMQRMLALSRYHLPFLLRLFKCWMSLDKCLESGVG